LAKYKAAMLLSLRKLLKQHGRGHELVFHRMLSDEALEVYKTAQQAKWIPADEAAQILIAAAQVLFPKDLQALRKLGREGAEDDLRGFATKRSGDASLFYILLQVARLWRMYHDQGRALAHDEGERRGTIVVENYPDLHEAYREVFAGIIQAALEMSGLRNYSIRRQEADPQAWKWVVSQE
jgi:hypothetical protein